MARLIERLQVMLNSFWGQAQKEDDDTVFANYADKTDCAAKAAEASSALKERGRIFHPVRSSMTKEFLKD